MREIKVSSKWAEPCTAKIISQGNEQGRVSVDKTTGTKRLFMPPPSVDRNRESWDVVFECTINNQRTEFPANLNDADRTKKFINLVVVGHVDHTLKFSISTVPSGRNRRAG